MIQSFKDALTRQLWETGKHRKVDPRILKATMKKLQMLDAAATLEDLMVPPSNRLETLSGDRSGQHSIRVNVQWRLCFTWTDRGPVGVEFCDYH